jgi:hypothetical protein
MALREAFLQILYKDKWNIIGFIFSSLQESLQQISNQQREAILSVRRDMERFEADRQKSIDQFKQVCLNK